MKKTDWGEKFWKRSIQLKSSLTVWKALHGRLAAEQFLKITSFANPSCCRFCYAAEEDINHKFLHCNF